MYTCIMPMMMMNDSKSTQWWVVTRLSQWSNMLEQELSQGQPENVRTLVIPVSKRRPVTRSSIGKSQPSPFFVRKLSMGLLVQELLERGRSPGYDTNFCRRNVTAVEVNIDWVPPSLQPRLPVSNHGVRFSRLSAPYAIPQLVRVPISRWAYGAFPGRPPLPP